MNNKPIQNRDESKSTEEQGLFNKFTIFRTDGLDAPGKKHSNCEYFVLDIRHDKFAKSALAKYAEACQISITHQEQM